MSSPTIYLFADEPTLERPAPPSGANAALITYIERIKPTLTNREHAVLVAVAGYFAAHKFTDVTGGELAKWSGLSIMAVRPRLTGLCKRGVLLRTDSVRKSRAKGEGRCHAYWPNPKAARHRRSRTT